MFAYVWYQCAIGTVIHTEIDECKENGSQTVCVESWAVPFLLRLYEMGSHRLRGF